MSIFDSISESQHEVISVAIGSEIGLKAQYEILSAAFWSRPTVEMTLALDKLLEVIEDITAWRKDTEKFMDDLDKDG